MTAPKLSQTIVDDYPIADLIPHPKNPNIGDLATIRASVGKVGFYGTVVVHKCTGHILAGNHRVQAARAEGMTTVPVCVVDCDAKTALRILAADNGTRRKAKTADSILADILRDLPDASVGTGYAADEVAEILRASRVIPPELLRAVPSPPPGVDDVPDEEDEKGATRSPGGAYEPPPDSGMSLPPSEDGPDEDDEPNRDVGRFPLAIVLTHAEKRQWDAFKTKAGVKNDKAALLAAIAGG